MSIIRNTDDEQGFDITWKASARARKTTTWTRYGRTEAEALAEFRTEEPDAVIVSVTPPMAPAAEDICDDCDQPGYAPAHQEAADEGHEYAPAQDDAPALAEVPRVGQRKADDCAWAWAALEELVGQKDFRKLGSDNRTRVSGLLADMRAKRRNELDDARTHLAQLRTAMTDLLDKLDTMTTEAFSHGADRPQREALAAALAALPEVANG